MSKKKRALRARPLFERVREILESARANVARTVNTTQVIANWLIGREIVEEEQQGAERAGYGEKLIPVLSKQITAVFGRGFSVNNLEHFRGFYRTYPELVESSIPHAARGKLTTGAAGDRKSHAARGKFIAAATKENTDSWRPGQLHAHLSWTHYRTLLRVEKPEIRGFYEIETLQNNWSARELERQINSLLYERLALSKDKKGVMRLAKKGQEIQTAAAIFKDPMVIEFLGLPESAKLVETDLEQALIDNLQAFLLELGKGFAFVARQQRITLDGDHFYVDLVFYHTILKCYVLIDLKTGKLTHQDLGQVQLYVNYYDRERVTGEDNPTLGLILCTDKNDVVVKYTLGADQKKQIFASKYKLHLPTEAELKAELNREVRALSSTASRRGPI
jgi:predicted nuclease of restriction endonuclease-like (RecB) superfamily